MPWSRALSGLVLLTGLVAVVLGCRQEVPPLFRQNRTPETTITVVAEESTTSFYRFHVFWRGEDPDGEVIRYLFAVTDTLPEDPEDRWDPSLAVDRELGTFTTRTDSVFLFNAGLGTQALNIVAIDDFGVMDPSPARQYFRVTDNGTPRVVYQRVQADQAGQLPCSHAMPCTIPMYSDFNVRFYGTTPNGFIRGVTWSANLGPYQPFQSNADTTFLALPKDTLVTGTTEIGTQGTLWAVDRDTVTVYHYTDRTTPIPSGPFEYKVNMIDDARRKVIPPAGDRIVTVNYDPDTRVYSVPECNCPRPPANCDPNRAVPVGWVTGIRDSAFAMTEWRMFCQGDTLPNLATVRFYANGFDDPRDGAKDTGAGLAETEYKFRYEFLGPAEVPSRTSNQNMPLSVPSLVAQNLTLPNGQSYRGATISWRTCSFDYRFQASAEDEQGRVDGRPASVDFKVGGSPVFDSLQVPRVIVFVPNCGPIFSAFCPQPPPSQANFGPDTLLVFGQHQQDTGGSTPFSIGFNRFVFPFKAWAHDHPRDKNPPGRGYYDAETVGRIRAWRFSFNCTTTLCQDLALPGEGAWRPETRDNSVDPPNQEVFDENLSITVPLDTFCVSNPCTQATIRAYPRSSRYGRYEFTLQGRDTPPVGARCIYNASLSAGASPLTLDVSEQGRRTAVLTRNTVWVQYRDVRPARPIAPAAFATPKRLMK